MSWIDDQMGHWIWQPEQGTESGTGSGAPPDPPTNPPPSATGTGTQGPAPAPAQRPDPPDASGLWQWDSRQNAWILPAGSQANHDAWQQRQILAQTVQQNAAQRPTMAGANALGYDAGQTEIDRIFSNQAANPNIIAGRQAPTVDTTQTDAARVARDQALADQRRVLEATLNTGVDPVEQKALEQRAFEQGLSNANTVAANARGGAGAVAAARMQVNQQMPQMAGAAAASAQQSEAALLNARIQKASTAGNIANTIGQTATGAFSQEAGLATDTAQIGLQTIDRAIADTGQHINASLQVQQQLGAMINDLNQLGLNYAALDEKTQEAIMDDLAKRYGIDQATYAAIKTASIQKKKGVLDWIVGIGGTVSGVVSAVGKTKGT
jgi:hypothetical protein